MITQQIEDWYFEFRKLAFNNEAWRCLRAARRMSMPVDAARTCLGSAYEYVIRRMV